MSVDRVRRWSTDGTVINASALFPGCKTQEERIRDFYQIAGGYPIEGVQVDPRTCIDYSDKHLHLSIFTRQTAARLSVFTPNSVTISDQLRLEAESGVKRFIFTPHDKTQSPDINYAIFVPNPDSRDPRIAGILQTLGVGKDKQYYLLTIGSRQSTLTDQPTKPEMEIVLQESDLSPTDFLETRAVEVTYIIFDNGASGYGGDQFDTEDETGENNRKIVLVKFATLPRIILGGRALARPEEVRSSDITATADAFSTIDHIDSGLILDTLTAIRHAAFGDCRDHATQPTPTPA